MIRDYFLLFIAVLFTFVMILPEPVDARRGGGGGARISRGGGGSFGSIRNSGGPSRGSYQRTVPSRQTQNFSDAKSRSPQSSQVRTADRDKLPAREDTGQNAKVEARRQAWLNQAPQQKKSSSERKEQAQDRYQNMSPEQQEKVQDRSEQAKQRKEDASGDVNDRLDERWDKREEAREDWQDWADDRYDDYRDDYWHSHWWYGGYHPAGISITYYVNNSPPCTSKVVLPDGFTYYNCGAAWYQSTYYQGQVKYVLVSAPTGIEMTSLDDYEVVVVDGEKFYVSGYAFYKRITRNKKHVYVVVDPPYGAEVTAIPEYAIKIENQGQTYYRWDKTFYQKSTSVTGGYVVVRAPA